MGNAAPQTAWSLDRTTTLDVESRALKLLERYRLLTVPVDVLLLAEKMGIQVFKATFEDEGISGGTEKISERRGKIWVNRFESEPRQRFTIAHEIGHWVMHMRSGDALSEPKQLVEWRKTDAPMSERERAANRFAAALLMPASLVASARDTQGSDLSRLAERFEVSLEAMAIRLRDITEL